MKTLSIITLIILSLTVVSSTRPKSNLPNANSWSISMGGKVLLASWKGNEMGDTVSLVKIKLKSSETLVAERFLCGYNGENAITTLTIKNSFGEKIAESVNENSHMMVSAEMSVKHILYSPSIESNEVLGVYFSIKDESGKMEERTLLLGYLKLN